MATILKVENRPGAGKYVAFDLRRQGQVPAVLYGRGMENINIQVAERELRRLIHGGERILSLDLAGQPHRVVLKEVQYGLFGEELLHADFRVVAETDIIEMTVPVSVHGEAPGLSEGGVLEQNLFSVHVACMPKDLPERITIDIAGMNLGDVKYVSDLPKLPGVRYLGGQRVAVLSIVRPMLVEAATPAAVGDAAAGVAAATPAEPEVVGEKERAEKAKEKEEAAKADKGKK